MTAIQPQVVWAEDNARDRMLIQESMDGMTAPPRLRLVSDGVFLIESLREELPALVVLDLKMPRLGGVDVLRRIRSQPEWEALPVTIFSSGNRPDEVTQCQALGVQEVVQKPVDFDLFTAAVQRVLRSAEPPTLARAAPLRPA